MNSFFTRIRNFMYGRNGFDKFSFALIFAYLILNGIKMCFRRSSVIFYIMWILAVCILVIALLRILSKNIYRRQREEQQFENFLVKINFVGIVAKFKKKLNRLSMRISQFSTHRFRTCPQCGEHLRLSKKRGKRHITCPICGRKFTAFIPF